ncbi:MAG: lipase maturation factor family protein [Thermoanaerobaculia bacterium]
MDPDGYALATWLFLRALGVVYLVAFASLAVQVRGLLGSRGVLPAGRLLASVREREGRRAYLALPSLLWLRSDDRALLAVCGAGVALSLLLTCGIAQVPALVGLYVLYLSLLSAAGPFLGYQWDALLLETGFLAIFAAPLDPLLGPALSPGGAEAHPLVRWLLYWLLFRVMFSSGLVKLRSGDPTWRSLTALDHHYQTQPLPHRGSWWAHQLPRPLQRLSTAGMFALELVVPFLVFAPPPWRWIAAGGTALLMLLVVLTGNYGFFNLLTVALCIPLLDDRVWAALLGPWAAAGPGGVVGAGAAAATTGWPLWVLVPVAAVVGLLSLARFGPLAGLGRPPGLRPLARALDGFRIVNGYGLFAVMTTERPELTVEGSPDGREWRPYRFRWKAGPPEKPPRWAMPHQPRLDWQMWFEALRAGRPSGWFTLFLQGLLEGRREVLGLLAEDPFDGEPPRSVRAVVEDYRFTDVETRRRTGRWWTARPLGLHHPPVGL